MSKKLYVGNLTSQTTSEDLQELFSRAGRVESIKVVEDRRTGPSRGFAFVEMATEEEAAAAIEQFNGKELGGRNLVVNEARERADRGPRGGGGNRQGGYGGGGGNYGGGRSGRGERGGHDPRR